MGSQTGEANTTCRLRKMDDVALANYIAGFDMGSHSEIIRAMVIAQLRIMRKEYDLKLMPPRDGKSDTNSV